MPEFNNQPPRNPNPQQFRQQRPYPRSRRPAPEQMYNQPYQGNKIKKTSKYNPKIIWRNFVHHTLGLELSFAGKIVLSVASAFLLIVFILGAVSTIDENKDKQKYQDIGQIVKALDSFYYNSSSVSTKRSYPLSVCSSAPNEVDFESTLRQVLTGQNDSVTAYQYIKPSDYPTDLQGEYQNSLQNRQYSSQCVDSISENAYKGVKKYCDFDSIKSPNCYLYTSSATGDKYQIGFYSQESRDFIIFEKNKNKDLILVKYQK